MPLGVRGKWEVVCLVYVCGKGVIESVYHIYIPVVLAVVLSAVKGYGRGSSGSGCTCVSGGSGTS